jgi:hypothetical protein
MQIRGSRSNILTPSNVVADFRVFKIATLRFINFLAGFVVCQLRALNIKRSRFRCSEASLEGFVDGAPVAGSCHCEIQYLVRVAVLAESDCLYAGYVKAVDGLGMGQRAWRVTFLDPNKGTYQALNASVALLRA